MGNVIRKGKNIMCNKEKLTEQISKAIKEMRTSHDNGTYHWHLGQDDNNDWAIVLGWQDGYEEDKNDDCTNGTYRICLKLAYQPINSMLQCDYDIDWLLPCNPKTGDIYESEYSIYPNSNIALYVHYLLRDAVDFKIIERKDIC